MEQIPQETITFFFSLWRNKSISYD